MFSPGAFALGHGRPGTLSLSLSENDDDPRVKGRPGYKSMEFLITTGAQGRGGGRWERWRGGRSVGWGRLGAQGQGRGA